MTDTLDRCFKEWQEKAEKEDEEKDRIKDAI